ncbi:peptidylprolyl isomerase [Verrucomicrobiota bacterium]
MTEKSVVIIETSMGTIKAELWPDKAPVTVENFLAYTDQNFFDGLIFHRVMNGFMIQGGGFNAGMREKQGNAPIKNEARADTPNSRGTLAMARTSDINSATSQFFINLVDNAFLNHKDETDAGFGYCVFGKVIEGIEVVDKIGKARTKTIGPMENVPVEPIEIKSIRKEN